MVYVVKIAHFILVLVLVVIVSPKVVSAFISSHSTLVTAGRRTSVSTTSTPRLTCEMALPVAVNLDKPFLATLEAEA